MTDPAPRQADLDARRRAEMLSSLADGELDAAQVPLGCRLWREDDESRRTWHAYQLIADVMRTDQLSSTATRDAAFLRQLRTRLAAEPVVLAPRPLADGPAPRRRWVGAAAAVAGVAAVAVVAVSMQGAWAPAPDGGTVLAGGAAPVAAGLTSAGVQRVGAAPAAASGQQVLVIDGNVIRDARLDAYFDAHRGAVGALPHAVPGGGALRSVEMIAPAKR